MLDSQKCFSQKLPNLHLILGSSEFEFGKNRVLRNEIFLGKNTFPLFDRSKVAKGPCLFASSDTYSKGLLDTDVVFWST